MLEGGGNSTHDYHHVSLHARICKQHSYAYESPVLQVVGLLALLSLLVRCVPYKFSACVATSLIRAFGYRLSISGLDYVGCCVPVIV